MTRWAVDPCPSCGHVRMARVGSLCAICWQAKQRQAKRDGYELWFWNQVDASGDCWVWTGCRNRWGYGDIRNPAVHRPSVAHRFAYEALVGPIPLGLTLDHLCRNTSCVNPGHLEPVTKAENTRRARSYKHRQVIAA